jgi:hypothetical protein
VAHLRQRPALGRPFTDLTYQPMPAANGYETFIFTGFGQDFVCVYPQRVYDIPPEQVVGSALATRYGYAKDGTLILVKEPSSC